MSDCSVPGFEKYRDRLRQVYYEGFSARLAGQPYELNPLFDNPRADPDGYAAWADGWFDGGQGIQFLPPWSTLRLRHEQALSTERRFG